MEVLADLGADAFEEKPHMADDGVIAENGVALLNDVVNADHRQRPEHQQRRKEPRCPNEADKRDKRQPDGQPENRETSQILFPSRSPKPVYF